MEKNRVRKNARGKTGKEKTGGKRPSIHGQAALADGLKHLFILILVALISL